MKHTLLMKRAVTFVMCGALGLGIASVSAQRATDQTKMPVFEVDATWPRLPNDWVMGQVPGIAVDRHDHVWILHRPRTVADDLKGRAAPPVIEFDENGKFVAAWGGSGAGFDWPDSEHGIFVDYKDNVWIGGSSPTSQSLTRRSDDMLLKFSNSGMFRLQIGGPDKSGGNADTSSVNKPADAFVYPKTNELFVADGYGNRRAIVFDAETGAFKRMWGAFGNEPVDAAPAPTRGAGQAAGGAAGAPARGVAPVAGQAAGAPARGRGPAPPLETEGPGPQQFGGPVHSVKVSNDDLVYVADRPNRRVQVFTLEGKFVTQAFINRAGPSSSSAAGIAFSPDAEQQFMYVVDYGNSRIVVLDRKSLTVLYQFGSISAEPGDFQGPHHAAVDSKGNIYVVEVVPGNRAQRFAFKGLSATPPANALTPSQLMPGR